MSVKIALAGNPNCGKTTLFNVDQSYLESMIPHSSAAIAQKTRVWAGL